jgi:hypothetical protein
MNDSLYKRECIRLTERLWALEDQMKLVEEQLAIERREHDICKTELVKAALRERANATYISILEKQCETG